MHPRPSPLRDEHGYTVRRASGIQEAYDHTRLLRGWSLTYEQISRGRFQGSLSEAWIDGIHLYQETLTQSVFQTGRARAGTVSLGVFAALSGPARWFGQELTLDDIMLLEGNELLLSTPRESTLLVLCLPAELLPPPARPGPRRWVRHPALAQQLRQQIQLGIGALLSQPLRFARGAARQQLRSDMQDLADACLRLVGTEPPEVRRGRAIEVVHGAIGYLTPRRDALVSIEDLCHATHTSRRALQNCFERVTGESPAQFLKTQRLNAVRRDILDASGQRLIGDLAIERGFWHFSQFSTDYKRLFGELPSDTARYAQRRRTA